MLDTLDFDWFILLLRLLFIFLLYFFLFQVVRVISREVTALAAPAGPSAAAPVSGTLRVVDGAESDLPPGASFALEAVTTIGRRPENTIPLNEPFVSANHAELVYDSGRWWLRDLGSTNGTFVNGDPVTVATGVRPGDVVQFGRMTLQLVPEPRS